MIGVTLVADRLFLVDLRARSIRLALFAPFLALTQALLHATLCYARSRASKIE